MLIPRVVFLAFSLALAARAQQPAPADRDKGVQSRGDHVMGFSHEKTTHHFRLYADGGAIEVTANDPADRSAVANQDAASRDQIRMHLRHIAEMFSEGNFAAPMLIHAQNPPGADVMKRLRGEIRYLYSDLARGAQIRIVPATSSPRIRGCVVPSFFGVFFVVLALVGITYLVLSATNRIGENAQQGVIRPTSGWLKTLVLRPRPLTLRSCHKAANSGL